MPRYNLLDEKWIQVASKDTVEKVSIKELFADAAKYKELAGDMKTQDFAVMRVMLAILHTVFSRFDSNGDPYEFFEVDEKSFLQTGELEENDLEDYEDALYQTWIDIWNAKEFPKVVYEYLEKWRERFFLYDDKYPFFQVTKEVIEKDAAGGGEFYGKNINRLVSESNNKQAYFSPKDESYKEYIADDELARWLITLQGYIGTSDKKKVGFAKTYSKGWLYDLGGVYLQGNNVFETLMLNFVIGHNENNNLLKSQKPCWEAETIEKNIELYFHNGIDNIASLYTAWCREIFIDPNRTKEDKFVCFIAKLPEIEHSDAFLEPMTVWKYNDTGEYKDKYRPRKHDANKSMWRNFGLLTGVGEGTRKPGVIEWLNKLCDISESEELGFNKENITLCAVCMLDDGNATSWAPIDEVEDTLNLKERVLVDTGDNGWIIRINKTISDTKAIIDTVLKRFIFDLLEIRNMEKSDVSKYVEQFYFRIDLSFRNWIESIDIDNDKDTKEIEWQNVLKKAMKEYVDELVSNAGLRDYKGIETSTGVKNIATIYNSFLYRLNQN
ncbi:CRISPR-associated protein Cse1 [Lachnoanaerobaculum sp. MSX33]|uniref:type I-E CRISPR-associated protein Cse1/CasA n=1 Tax=Lachnoanaerobaculum sp. MSX33 TaxID=936596 RepID=UPI0003DF8853|nr:type I-E CRISPR-associated protein Cse1/CasA [Lachnoanaerobaculum sp. MSX33]ETO96090.1 CRISPR-associated protein Cse1 [Lachnoanaerobaculum sp. MSX33]